MVSARTVCGPSPSRRIVTPACYGPPPDPECPLSGGRNVHLPPGPGRLPGAGGGAVAVEDFGLVLVPRAGRPVRVHDQRPAPPVDDDLVVERAEQHAVLD